MNNVSMRDTLRGVALVGLGLLTVQALVRVPSAVEACGVPAASETARGHVFEDTNGNGGRDAGEPGVSGVAVSNGCAVTVTDDGGAYAVAVAPGQILFITKPSRYAVAVDEHNVAQFFYRHYPAGTPTTVEGSRVGWRFPVVEATGPLPAAVDFPLYPLEAASDRFLAHGFADPQARFDISQDMLREDLVNTLMGNPYGVQFGLTMGDVANDNLTIYDRHKRMMSLLDVPQWYLPGNHDLNFASPDERLANETYKRHFGPTYYSFDHGNVHFVALNNVEYAGVGTDGQNLSLIHI